MDVKKNIRKFREWNTYSQEYVAVKLGISQQAYSLIESGDTKVDAELLKRLAEILHVGVEQFFTGEGEPENGRGLNGAEDPILKKVFELTGQLIESKNETIASKNSELALRDKVIRILRNGNGKKRRRA